MNTHFANCPFYWMTDSIIKFFSDNKKETSKKLYTGTLHEFGLKDGVAIYRLLKDVV